MTQWRNSMTNRPLWISDSPFVSIVSPRQNAACNGPSNLYIWLPHALIFLPSPNEYIGRGRGVGKYSGGTALPFLE